MSASHHQPEHFDLSFRSRNDAHYLATKNHRNAIGKVEDLIEFGRDEKDAAPLSALGEQLGPNSLDRSHI